MEIGIDVKEKGEKAQTNFVKVKTDKQKCNGERLKNLTSKFA